MWFTIALKALEYTVAAADMLAKAREVSNALRTAAQQSGELTAEQSAELDRRAEEIFSGPASQPSGR